MSELAELDGLHLVYEDRGEGFPILLLHGIPTRRYLWRGVIPILTREGFRAIAPDLVGFGESEAPPEAEIHVANQAAWMVAFLDRLSIERAVVVGHDIGGGVAQIMAVRYTERVGGLVLINSAFDESWPVEAMKRMAGWDPFAAAKLHDLLVERLPAQATVGGMADADIRALLAPYKGEQGGLKLIRMAASLDNRHTHEIAQNLEALTLPVRVVWGEEDPFQPLHTVGQSLAAALGVEPVVVRGGHLTMEDAPEEVAREILAVAREAVAPPSSRR